MSQEAGHQWLAFLMFDDAGVSSNLLLGRDFAHWSFFLDSDASDMEGNNWVDNTDGTFKSNELTIRYSLLDQYAMGLRSASEVPDFFFIRDPIEPTRTRSSSPEIGVTVSGTRQNVSISQITAIEGVRPLGFTGVNPTTVWHQAFILLVRAGTTPSSTDLSKIETIRSSWVPYFANAVGGRGSISTTLGTTPPNAAVALNGASFRTGDTVGYQATLTPGSAPTQIDIYLGTLLPDGATFVSFVPSPGGTIAFAFGPVCPGSLLGEYDARASRGPVLVYLRLVRSGRYLLHLRWHRGGWNRSPPTRKSAQPRDPGLPVHAVKLRLGRPVFVCLTFAGRRCLSP